MNHRTLAALAATTLVAGCGGSDGGGGGNLRNVSFMDIDGSNARAAAAASYQASRDSAALSEMSGEAGFTASAPGDTAKTDATTMLSKTGGASVSQVPLPEQRVPCEISGEVIFNIDLADPVTPSLTSGDSFDVEFDMCIDTVGESTDGLLEFDVDAFAGEFLSGLYDLTMSMRLTNFNVVTPDDNILSNGDATVRIDTEMAPYVEASVSGESFVVDSNAGSQSVLDFSSTQTFDGNLVPAPYTFMAAGTVDSTDLPGAVRYSTPVTFEGFDDDYPNSGELLIEGENSAAKLIAIDNVDVRIIFDADGDGDFEGEILTTWAELAAR